MNLILNGKVQQKTRVGDKMKIIFLDIDGVLNTSQSKSRCGMWLGIDNFRVRYLKNIIEASGALIVLTSTWGMKYKVGAYIQDNQVGKYLNNKLRRHGLKIYDKIDDFIPWNHRGLAIQKWLNAHPDVTDYVILDDEIFKDYFEYNLMPHLIKTCADCGKYSGLTEDLVMAATAILNNGATGPFIDYHIWTDLFSGFAPDKEDMFKCW